MQVQVFVDVFQFGFQLDEVVLRVVVGTMVADEVGCQLVQPVALEGLTTVLDVVVLHDVHRVHGRTLDVQCVVQVLELVIYVNGVVQNGQEIGIA